MDTVNPSGSGIFRINPSKEDLLCYTIPMSKALKTKQERLSDSITILHKILEIGVEKDSTEYLATKTHLDGWIASGEPGTFTIPFPTYGRVAHMTLPKYEGVTPIYVLKVRERKSV